MVLFGVIPVVPDVNYSPPMKHITALLIISYFLALPVTSSDYYKTSNNPEILFEGTLSNDLPQWNNYFNRRKMFGLFTQMEGSSSRIIKYDYRNDDFQEGVFLPFDEKFNYSDPWINKEGDYMLLQANIGLSGIVSDQFKICETFLTDQGWTQPTPIPELVNHNSNEGSPSLAKNGNLYFNALNENGDYDIFVLRNGNDEPEALSKNINSGNYEGDFFMDDKEQFIVFSSANRNDSQGGSDLYISFNIETGWTPAIPLNKGINTNGEDFSPYITNDRKQLIFTSNRNNSMSLRPSFNHYIIDFDILEIKYLLID